LKLASGLLISKKHVFESKIPKKNPLKNYEKKIYRNNFEKNQLENFGFKLTYVNKASRFFSILSISS